MPQKKKKNYENLLQCLENVIKFTYIEGFLISFEPYQVVIVFIVTLQNTVKKDLVCFLMF